MANDSLLLDYYQDQRFAEALALLKKVYPEPVNGFKTLGKLAYTSQMAGNLPDAENYYQRMYLLDSNNKAVLFNLGSINLRRGNNIKAEIYYKVLSQRDTTNFFVYKQLGKIAADKADIPALGMYLQKANKLNPAEADVASDLSDMYVGLKQYAQAENVLNAAISQDADNVVLLQSFLKLAYSQNKYTEVENTCLKLINLGVNSAYVLTKLEAAYYNLKLYACCVETFAEIPAISQSETSYYIAALAYKALKDQQSAIANLKKAIEAGISPNITDYYAEMADSYGVNKNYRSAMTAYQKSLQFHPKTIIYYLMATMYDSDLKNKKLALKYYKKFISGKLNASQQKYVAYARARAHELSY